MTESGLLEHIFDRLSRADSGEEIFGADEVAQWPESALEALVKSGLLERAEPARVIECDGCERNCFMPVHVRPAEGNQPARAFISCDKPDDVGRVPVELGRLSQWRITGGMLAAAMARLLGFTNPPHEDSGGNRWTLGQVKGKEYKGEVKLSVEGGVALMVAGQNIPLVHVLTLNRRGLKADKDALLRLVDGDARQPRQAWGPLRGASKPRRPPRTHDTTGLAAAATSEDEYARYGPRRSIRPVTSALNRNARPWACHSLLQEKF
jgi:hypothetical protein